MQVFLYWLFGSFLYFKIATNAADFTIYQLTTFTSLLLAITLTVTIYEVTKIYHNNLLDSLKKNQKAKASIHAFIISSLIFFLISRLIIYGFSNKFSSRLSDEEEFFLMLILTVPLFLHYLTILVSFKSENTIHHDTKSFFIIKLFRGDISLAITYWIFGVLLGIALQAVEVGIHLYSSSRLLIISFYSFYALYGIFISIAIWRSAEKYKGHRIWSFLAQFQIVIGLLLMILVFFQ